MSQPYHLKIDRSDLGGADIALIPGDPGRVPRLARRLDPDAVEIGNNREFRSFRARAGDCNVVVCSTGIGGPSAVIACEELAQLGVRTFLRVGTTGAIVRGISPGSVVIPTAAVRREGTSGHFLPADVPAVADAQLVHKLYATAMAKSIPAFLGPCCTSDTFYPGQERRDTYSGRLLPRFDGATDLLEACGILNYEMECAPVFAFAMQAGLRAAAVLGVVINRHETEHVGGSGHKAGEQAAIEVACSMLSGGGE